MSKALNYQPLTPESLPLRLNCVKAVTDQIGTDTYRWRVQEVGDGNLNLVFIVQSDVGSVIVKQALPYVRLVGDSWPLPLSRSYYEYHALTRQAARAPDKVPAVQYFDEVQALIVMEFLSPHHILRYSLQTGQIHETLGKTLGQFCANTLFKGSDYYMESTERKLDVALFSGNAALCDITESLVFTDPYYDAPMNRHTSPQLDGLVAHLRADDELKFAAQRMKFAFCSQAETMLHGDLHTGSVMVHGDDAKVIDPEFVLYGPMGFDLGMLTANFILAWCAQPGYATQDDNRQEYRVWIQSVITDVWHHFDQQFSVLWKNQRHGILYPASLFEDQGHETILDKALQVELARIWTDAMGFCGCEMIRRTLGLAHIAEYDDIEEPEVRSFCEAAGLRIARTLLVDRHQLRSLADVFSLMQAHAPEIKV